MYAAEDQEVPYFQASSLLKLTLLAENPKMIFRSLRFDISSQRGLSQRKKVSKTLATQDVSLQNIATLHHEYPATLHALHFQRSKAV